jgi:hypothetical protein
MVKQLIVLGIHASFMTIETLSRSQSRAIHLEPCRMALPYKLFAWYALELGCMYYQGYIKMSAAR